MIKNTNRIESERIAFSLNYHVAPETACLSFTQDADTKIALLKIKEASHSIIRRISKAPEQAQKLRWVRNTNRNKSILATYLMRRVVKTQLWKTGAFHYMPCCNTFSERKPKAENGHKQVTNDCLLLLLGEEVKSQVLTFKKQERKKSLMVSSTEFKKLFQSKILPFFKDKTPLEWVGGFIESLPKKEGCFQLPLIKNKPFFQCPGLGAHSVFGKPLQFKVDLMSHEPDWNSLRKPSSPSNCRRTELRFTKPPKKKKNKRLKTQVPQTFLESQSSSEDFGIKRKHEHPQKSIFRFQASPQIAQNFKMRNENMTNFEGPLFKEEASPQNLEALPDHPKSESDELAGFAEEVGRQYLKRSSENSATGTKKENLSSQSLGFSMLDLNDMKISKSNQSIQDHRSPAKIQEASQDSGGPRGDHWLHGGQIPIGGAEAKVKAKNSQN